MLCLIARWEKSPGFDEDCVGFSSMVSSVVCSVLGYIVEALSGFFFPGSREGFRVSP